MACLLPTLSYARRGYLVRRVVGGSPAYWSWSYDAENQLTRVQTDEYSTPEASRWKVEFVYDGTGRMRIQRDYTWLSGYGWYPAGETRYLYDLPAATAAQAGGLLIVQERSAGNLPLVTYTRGRDLSGSLAGAGGIGGLLARSHGYSGGNWSSHNAYHADGNGSCGFQPADRCPRPRAPADSRRYGRIPVCATSAFRRAGSPALRQAGRLPLP